MMYQALYRKWRPLVFSDVVGQKHITDTLRNQLISGKLSHAYLFTGTRGTGKTTCAKILARAVNCEQLTPTGDPCNQCPSCRGILDGSILDVVEIDAASNNGVDNIRDIRDETRYTPANVKKRVYIIDEVHMLSQGAFNALLKTLEEPPAHVLFVLATTELHKVPATILSRCQRFDFRRIADQDLVGRLWEVAEKESIAMTEGGARAVARLADGSMRDALSILDRVYSGSGEVIDEARVAAQVGILEDDDAARLLQGVIDHAYASSIEILDECYRGGKDLSGVFTQLLELIRDVLLYKTAGEAMTPATSNSIERIASLGEGISPSRLIAYSDAIQQSLLRMAKAQNKKVEAEVCMIRLCRLSGEHLNDLAGRVEELEARLRQGAVVSAGKPEVAEHPGKKPAKKALGQTAESKNDAPQKEAAPQPVSVESVNWEEILRALPDTVNIAVRTNLRVSSGAVLRDGKLVVLAQDPVTYMLTKPQEVKDAIAAAARKVLGRTVMVEVKEQQEDQKSAIDAVLDKAQKLQIKTTKF